MNSIKLSDTLLELLESTLRIKYVCGDVTQVLPPHSTGWRVFTEAVFAFISEGENRLEIANEPPRHMRSDEAFLTPPGVRHCITNTSGTPRYQPLGAFPGHGLQHCGRLSLLRDAADLARRHGRGDGRHL